jgi:succinate dehydrogenase / fumarate reductase flavoprotein subunit
MWDYCGMARNATPGLKKALDEIPELRDEFWQRRRVPAPATT